MTLSQKITALFFGIMGGFVIGYWSNSWEFGIIGGFTIFNTFLLMALTSETY